MDNEFKNYVESIKDLDRHLMIENITKKISNLESISKSIKTKDRDKTYQYVKIIQELKELSFWLQNGSKPLGIKDENLLLLRGICKNLIKKGQLKPESLEQLN